MEASVCSSTDTNFVAAFYNLPRPLQVLWTQNNDPSDFNDLPSLEQQQWSDMALKYLKNTGALCAICDYLEVRHACSLFQEYDIDKLLRAFVISEGFDLDDARHAILVIFQAIKDDFEVGYHCRNLIQKENFLNDIEEVDYNYYILKTFYEATSDLFDCKSLKVIKFALFEKVSILSKHLEKEDVPIPVEETEDVLIPIEEIEDMERKDLKVQQFHDTNVQDEQQSKLQENLKTEIITTNREELDIINFELIKLYINIGRTFVAQNPQLMYTWIMRLYCNIVYQYRNYFKHKHLDMLKYDTYTSL